MKDIFALVDCNSFYVSCERIFRPDLEGKPVGVLSNNDGCIVALSKELKDLGIKRGTPAFQIAHLVKKHNIILFSSNYTLYGDISARIMNVLSMFTPDLEIYSIDEAFLSLKGMEHFDLEKYAKEIKDIVWKWIGVPVSVGIGETKTLAKIANHIAKKYKKFAGVFNLLNHPQKKLVLSYVKVSDIWGIGNKYAQKLNRFGIHTVSQFIECDENFIEKEMTIVGLKTLKELKGYSCIVLDDYAKSKKQIISSKSFGKPISDFDDLMQAISSYLEIALEKLRNQRSVASQIMIFLTTNPFKNSSQYANYVSASLEIPSAYSPTFIQIGRKLLKSIYKEGYQYKKVGVMISNIQNENEAELDFFKTAYIDDKHKDVMEVFDKINRINGRNTIYYSSSGINRKWEMRREFLSKRYTTNWKELPIVKAI
jgi:DNA polymerase V